MSKAKTKAQKRRDKRGRASEAQAVCIAAPGVQVAASSARPEPVRPTPERIAQGGVELPSGKGSRDAPARIATPDCVAALCIEPRRITQAQENAARAFESLRWRVRAELGVSEGRSCLDISPVGHDDGDGDEALAAEWRRVRGRLGPKRVAVLDATIMHGKWPRLPEFRDALDAFDLC